VVTELTRNWWAFVLQGVVAVAVGIATFVVPDVSLTAFIAVFAAYAFVIGIFEIAGGLSMATGPKWSLVLGGIASIAIGVLTFANPGNTALAVTLLVGIWAVATGVAQVAAANLLGTMSTTVLLALSGIASVIFGVLLIAAPGQGVLAVLWLIGFYAIFAGTTMIGFGLRLRSVNNDVSQLKSELAGATTPPTTSTPSAAASR
jgi:uncharacterized membrane protein HdeD (DUF308 family)